MLESVVWWLPSRLAVPSLWEAGVALEAEAWEGFQVRSP